MGLGLGISPGDSPGGRRYAVLIRYQQKYFDGIGDNQINENVRIWRNKKLEIVIQREGGSVVILI